MRAGPVRPYISLVAGLILVAIGLAGLLDALFGETWDLAVLFGLVALIGLVGVISGFGARRPVTLRADLASRLLERSRLGGESLDQVLDRSVATYLHVLRESDPEDP